MPLAYDSTHRLDPEVVKRAGGIAVLRYLQTGSRPSWKSVSRDEIAAYFTAGLGFGAIWESTAIRATQGYSAGLSDARKANQVCDDLGLSDKVTIIWTVDTDVSGYRAVSEYDRGWVAGSKRPTAPYGEASVIDGSVAAGRSRTGWQTNARGWSGYRISKHASIIQGLPSTSKIPDTDPNQVLDVRTPLLWFPNRKPAPSPYSPPEYPGAGLREGMNSDDVAAWKIMLTNAGYRGFSMRGAGVRKFTKGTRWATARFQRNNGLTPVTGVVGPKTWAKMRAKLIALHGKGRR